MAVVSRKVAACMFMAATCFPAQAEEPAAPVTTDWSGYHFGYALATPRGDNTWRIENTSLALLPGDWTRAMPILRAGRDWQTDRFVYGISASVSGGEFFAQPASAFFITCVNCQIEVSDLITLGGRAGVAAGRTLFFAQGGLAHANVTGANVGGAVIVGDDGLTGWTAGLGAEHMIGENLSLSMSYDRVDLGSLDLSTYSAGAVSDVNFGTVQVGMNLHW